MVLGRASTEGVLRRGSKKGFSRRHAFSESRTSFACTLELVSNWKVTARQHRNGQASGRSTAHAMRETLAPGDFEYIFNTTLAF